MIVAHSIITIVDLADRWDAEDKVKRAKIIRQLQRIRDQGIEAWTWSDWRRIFVSASLNILVSSSASRSSNIIAMTITLSNSSILQRLCKRYLAAAAPSLPA